MQSGPGPESRPESAESGSNASVTPADEADAASTSEDPTDWQRVTAFRYGPLGSAKSPSATRTAGSTVGIRILRGGGSDAFYTPCAFAGDDRRSLYLSDGSLLCTVDAAETIDDVRHDRVRAADGELVGTIRRIPPARRLLKHTWRIDQPGRPEIVGRNLFATTDPRRLAAHTADTALSLTFDTLLSGPDGSIGPVRPRVLAWKAAGDLVMTTDGRHQPVRVLAPWIDRRLAFTFAMLGDE
ncbi:hypothetical protein OG948_30635 [Embleya sp. NBC_00888]|uniref:hypothetical protein n=1 Tax=Embleya sp. NBC_00888 TaxID=2975960 RepID=UPI00386F957B|nr:hypothetical protein OG948_30635 [Embleya sp. NBC_00888]